MNTWEKIGVAGRYGIWRLDRDGEVVYRLTRAPIIPQGIAGYYSLQGQLDLFGVKREENL